MTQLPTIAGIILPVDEASRVSLNALHRASGANKSKAPNEWLRTKTAQKLVEALSSQTGDSRPTSELSTDVLQVVNGGNNPGTYADILLAISYAGWISTEFQLEVNRTYLAYKTGQLVEVTRTLTQEKQTLVHENEGLKGQLEEARPLAEFAKAVARSDDDQLIRDAAKVLDVPPLRLYALLRFIDWTTQTNKPKQSAIKTGYLSYKISEYMDELGDERTSTTTLVTTKGMFRLRTLLIQYKNVLELL